MIDNNDLSEESKEALKIIQQGMEEMIEQIRKFKEENKIDLKTLPPEDCRDSQETDQNSQE